MAIPFRDLDDEIRKWGNEPSDPSLTLLEWVSESGSLRELAAYASVLWPEFVEYDNRIFRSDANLDPNVYAQWLQSCKGDKSDVQAVINHQHILELFGFNGDPENGASRELVRYVGNLLKTIWQAKLAYEFPGRRFTVWFNDGEFEDIMDYQITFHEECDEALRPEN